MPIYMFPATGSSAERQHPFMYQLQIQLPISTELVAIDQHGLVDSTIKYASFSAAERAKSVETGVTRWLWMYKDRTGHLHPLLSCVQQHITFLLDTHFRSTYRDVALDPELKSIESFRRYDTLPDTYEFLCHLSGQYQIWVPYNRVLQNPVMRDMLFLLYMWNPKRMATLYMQDVKETEWLRRTDPNTMKFVDAANPMYKVVRPMREALPKDRVKRKRQSGYALKMFFSKKRQHSSSS